MLRLQGGEAPALFLDISLFLFLILYQGVYRLYRGVCKLHPPAFDDCGSVSMQNDECKMKVFPSEMIIICPQSGHHNSAFSI